MAALKPEICRDVISERRILSHGHCVTTDMSNIFQILSIDEITFGENSKSALVLHTHKRKISLVFKV